jgi:hypothetical protein
MRSTIVLLVTLDPDGSVSHLLHGHLISDAAYRTACGRLAGVPSPPSRGLALRAKAGRGGIDSSLRQEGIHGSLIAKAVLPTDEVMKAVD